MQGNTKPGNNKDSKHKKEKLIYILKKSTLFVSDII